MKQEKVDLGLVTNRSLEQHRTATRPGHAEYASDDADNRQYAYKSSATARTDEQSLQTSSGNQSCVRSEPVSFDLAKRQPQS